MELVEVTATIPAMSKMAESRPSVAMGQAVRTIRKAKKIRLADLSEATGLHISQLSNIENGKNVEVRHYEAIAKALGFRNALELFRAPGDPVMRRLWRYWPLLDEDARKDVLLRVKATIDADEE